MKIKLPIFYIRSHIIPCSIWIGMEELKTFKPSFNEERFETLEKLPELLIE